jgi:hypothetical protein
MPSRRGERHIVEQSVILASAAEREKELAEFEHDGRINDFYPSWNASGKPGLSGKGIFPSRTALPSDIPQLSPRIIMSQPSLPRSARRRGRWIRVLLWSAFGLVLTGVIAVLGAYAWVKKYLAGEEFRALVAARAGQTLQSEVTLDPLVWDRLNVSTDKVSATGGSRISRLEITEPKATISLTALTTGYWTVENASIERVVADLKTPPAKSSPGAPSGSGPVAPPAGETEAATSGLPRWFPTEVRVPTLQIRELNLRFGQGDMDFRLLKTGALLTRRDATSYDMALRGGEFSLAPFPGAGIGKKSFDVIDATLRTTPGTIFVLDSRMRAADGTTLAIQGTSPGSSGDGPLDIQYTMESLPVAQVLGGEWANRVFGRLTVTGQSQGEGDTLVHTGTAELADARFLTPPPATTAPAEGALGLVTKGWRNLTGTIIPVLGAYTDRTVQFRNLVCDTASCRYRKEGDRINLTDIKIRSRSLLGVEGTLDITGEQLDGRLMVGVSRETLAGIPGAETKVFTIERDGLVWTPVRITGTFDNLKEDLTDRLVDAAGARILDELPNLDTIRQTIETLDPGQLRDGVLDQGGKIIEEGGKLIDGILPLRP